MMAASSDAINGFVHNEGREISLINKIHTYKFLSLSMTFNASARL